MCQYPRRDATSSNIYLARVLLPITSVDTPDRPNSQQLFAHSLLCSFAAVGLTYTLDVLLETSIGVEHEWLPLLAPLSSQLPVLLPVSLGMAWVSSAVESAPWRSLILGGVLAQLPLTQYVAELFDLHFHPAPVAFALLTAAIFPRLFFWKKTTAVAPQLEPQPKPLPVQIAPKTTVTVELPVLLAETLDDVAPAPSRVQASILHCELLNHAQLAQSLPSSEFTDLLNRLLGICMDTSAARGGLMDRSDSESFRAFFTQSKPGESHAESAVYTALTLRTRIFVLSEECELKCGRELDIRIGINSGEVLLAHFGPQKHQHLGVAGEAAEWGRRLACANQLYGSKILISSQTLKLADSAIESRPIDLLQRQMPPEAPEEVFEVLTLTGTLSPDAQTRLTHYKEGVANFRARHWSAARKSLRAALPVHGNDDTIDLLIHRIDEQEALAGLILEGH